MGFIDKVTETITGKTKQQRESDRLASNIAKREISKATFAARQEQAIRVAREREKIRADAQLRQMKNRYNYSNQSYSSPFGSIGGGGYSPFGRSSPAPVQTQRIRVPIRKSKRKSRPKYRYRSVRVQPQQPSNAFGF